LIDKDVYVSGGLKCFWARQGLEKWLLADGYTSAEITLIALY